MSPPVYRWRPLCGAMMFAAGLAACGLLAVTKAGAADRPGLPALGPWTCPASHPIKGYVSAEAGRLVYFLPAHPFYDEASPERCYASEDEARHDGGRPAGAPATLPATDGLANLRGRDLT
jgi:hypothetical protein